MYPPNASEYQMSSPPSAPPPEFSHYAQPPPPQQPPYGGAQYATGVPVQSAAPVPWSTGLCDCCDDVPNCCLTCWCPCITFGRIAEIVDKGTTQGQPSHKTACGVHGALYALLSVVGGCAGVYSCVYRSKMRRQYMLPESPCNDCLLHCCCDPCALCQEYRELKNRGFDMSIGWEGNMERQNRGVAMAPVVHGGMTR